MKFLSEKQERERFLKFSFVGFTGTFVDFGAMNLLRLVFNLPLVWAQGISFSLGVLNNFLWNRFWTYPDSRSKNASHQFIQFLLINFVGILVRTPLIAWIDRFILKSLNNFTINFPVENFVLSQNLALAISIFIILFWNFFANRLWTYNDVLSGLKHKDTLCEKSSDN